MKGLVIAGPTGVGKTELSLKLAEKLKTEIISADSMQIYKGMDIGTAKIKPEEMNGIKHYIIDIISPDEDYSVGNFERDVNGILEEKEKNNEDIIIAGGTGLYINAVTNGISELPEKDENLRKNLSKKSLEELQEELYNLDPESYNEIDIKNKIRVLRALEVCILSGEKFSILKNKNIKRNNYNFMKVLLVRDREELYSRIDKRVDIMMNDGLLHEAEEIYNKYKNSLYKISAIGYKELFSCFNGEISLENAVDKIKMESRRYAKRQMTWFRREKDYHIYNLSIQSENEIFQDILEKWENYNK
ncbi:tRNA (adenosine(37)-N6)-dimethylallyltransferase MiaA [Sebaldella sp. S0638]|uniref:tRNA (adenosine(37)-N6)-dimethylallyltransferase MiaA n=1 Tax=Sebaldella sp. S0638 TaxID=2957809 RepID=UPI0020A094A9|nr:tRNA (adenosine(37)-N6)-dimethylallyltransferase MiaA [Sebaldella sp. S0638]MCP1223403.1 tRNA (adenosine(37)-N6)-dimethylallyltransferase MiaA [Sebaldella sp. S0638]